MAITFCKAIDLVFNTWAIAGTCALNAALVHRTSIEPCFQNIVYFLAGICNITAALLFGFDNGNIHIRETSDLLIALLFFHFGIVEATSINSWRSTCFQAIAFES